MNSRIYRKIVNPQGDQVSDIINGLNAFGLQQTGGEAPDRVAVVSEGHGRDLVGGAIGYSIRGRFYLTQLWVAEKHRANGIGTELVSRMEAIARERGCHDVVVDTLSNQAVSFYEQLGYRVYMVNQNYIRGFDWSFLSKEVGQ